MNALGEFYQTLFDANLDPMAVLDGEGGLLMANRAARALLEFDDALGDGMSLRQLGFVTESFEEVVRTVSRGVSATWETESAAGAATRVLEIRLSRLPGTVEGDSSATRAYLWVAHDVTDRVRLERARQDVVHMVVHDLRVPLGNILNSLDLVLSAWREQDLTIPVAQILEIGLRSAHRMEQLVNDILDSARLQARRHPLAVVDISVQQIVGEAVESLSSSAARKGQTLRTMVQPDLPPMQGDPDLLVRVLVNLLSNAVKFVQEGGDILVGVGIDAEVFQFTISDNGPGVSEEDQVAIFELYARADTQRVKGAGIGLAFCRLAVAAHGGRIWLDSVPGEGASFHFTIPRVLPESAVFHQDTQV
jgi:signal transduction histidine kinase